MADNYAVTAHKVIGLNIQVAQGDSKMTVYYPKCNISDYDNLKAAIEASGEWSCLGFAPVYRSEAFLDGNLTIAESSATDVTKFVQVGVRRTALVGDDEVDMKTLYIKLPISDNASKAEAVATAMEGKKIGGADVVSIFRQSAQDL